MVRQSVLVLALLAHFAARADQGLVQRIREGGYAAKIHPQLLQKLATISPSEKIAVWIQLRDRPRYDVKDLPQRNFLPPVRQSYIDAAKNLPGAELLGVSELTNEVSVLIPAGSILHAVALPFVGRVEESLRFEFENHPAYGAYQALGYNAIAANPLQDATWGGYYWDTTGANDHKRIAILDSGIWPHHPAFWVSEKLLPTSFGDTLSHKVPISVAAWTSWVHLLPKRSDDRSKLYYMRSSDYGITWDTARVIADAGSGSLIMDYEIGAASDGTTQYVVALYIRLWYDANGPRNTVTVVRSADGGTTWSAPLELYTSPTFSTLEQYYVDHIGLAVTVDGGTVWAHAAWNERSFVSPGIGIPPTVTGEVKLRRSNALGANTWMAVQTIFSEVKPPTGGIAPFSYAFTELDASAHGADAHIVFHRVFNDGTDPGNMEAKLFLYASGNNGGAWADVYSIVFATSPPLLPAYPSVATKDGTGHVVFGRDSTLRYTRFPSPPGSPVLLTTSVAASPIPDIAVTRDTSTVGTFRRIVHVGWYDARDGVISVRYKRHPNGGDPATAWDDGDTNPANNNTDVSKRMSFDYAPSFWIPALSIATTDESANKLALVHLAWRDTRSVDSKKYVWYANSTKVVDWRDYVSGTLKPREFGTNDHGTEVSSVAAGAVVDRTSGNGDYNPFMGTAYNAVLAVAAYNAGSYEASLINGIKWAVDTTGADVLNMSLGFPDNDAVADSGARRVTQYVDWAVGRGLVVTKSAGNRGTSGASTITPPGDNFNALTVGGTNRPGLAIMPISSRGPVMNGRIKPDIVAPGGDGNGAHASGPTAGPGGDIYTAEPDPNSRDIRMYDWWEGTSYAAPHVAGLAAMLLRAHPTWTPGAIRKALQATAAAVTGAARPNNNEGWGRVQGNAANGFNPAPFPPSILPTAVEFQDSTDTLGAVQLRILVKPNGGVDSVIASLAAFGVAGTVTLADSGTIAGGWHVFKANYTIPASTGGGLKHILVTAYRNGAGAHDTVRAYINLYHPDIPVPVQLAAFTGRQVSPGRVLLEWMTISEINNYGFEVQRSSLQQTGFATIPNSFVPGHGTTLEPQYYSYLDTTATPALPFYRLRQIDLDGTPHYSDAIHVVITSVDDRNVPRDFALHQNSPNPFNPVTQIRFDVPVQTHVRLLVYDVLGREVKRLVDEVHQPGFYAVAFDGSALASGVYYYRLVAGPFTATRAMVFVK